MATNTPDDANTLDDASTTVPAVRTKGARRKAPLHTRLTQRLHANLQGPRRYALAALALAILIAAALFVLATDDNKKIPPTAGTPEQIEDATTLRDTITNTVNVPDTTEHPTTETLLTPTGDDWWELITSMGPDTQLWDAPTPDNANWYALNTTKAYQPANPKQAMNQTIHIGFNTTTQATTYRDAIAEYAPQNATVIVRGNIITISPLWVDPYKQPYPKPSAELTAAGKATTPIASWYINYGQTRELLLAENKTTGNANAISVIYRQLGYTDTTHWTGTATSPTGPFTGTIADYKPDTVDMLSAYQAVQGAYIQGCADDNDPNTCTVVDDTIDNFTAAVAWYRPLGPDAPAPQTMQSIPGIANDNTNYLPDTDTLPAGTILAFGTHLVAEKGALTGLGFTYDTPISIVQGVITPNGTDDSATLHLTPIKGVAQADWEIEEEDPDSDYMDPENTAGPMEDQTDKTKPAKKPEATVPPNETDFTIDNNGNVVPNKTPKPTNKPPVPIPTGTPTKVPMPPVPTTVDTDPGTALPEVATNQQ